ncbi:MAG: C-GCAxxG-C-C family protein [Desulfobulbaceae bacterium]|nr:C-GCAxxG-C-C family protein [Desulfobulbaceae bacterium]HIJ78691.1 C_GCAxxG_C_C family protein [Deltaproteobacteria bacterium]
MRFFKIKRKPLVAIPQHEELAILAGKRAGNIYDVHKICCAEAVLLVLNQGFGGGFTPEVATNLGSSFCHGMGGAECVCGALAGGELALSIFLGPRLEGGMKKKEFDKVARQMHDRFQERYGSTCCRNLLKLKKEKKGATCKQLTQGAAEICVELILEQRPELVEKVDLDYLRTEESKVKAMAARLLGKG